MKRLIVLSAAAALLFACEGPGTAFRGGFPSADNVKLEVPGRASSALSSPTGQQRQEVKGQTADFYKLTRGVTAGVNAGVGMVLNLVRSIADHPPTSVQGDTAVWGPHTEDLSPNTWKFSVTRTGPDAYAYQLEGKAKQDPDTAYLVVLSGTHQPAVDAQGNHVEHFGKGGFTLDWDKAQKLPEHHKEVGKAQVTYSRMDASSNTTIDVAFTQVKDEETGKLIDAEYRYLKLPQQGGEFEFSLDKDVHADDDQTKPQLEHLTIKSRWTSQGAGRSDVRATGGELPQAATASQCWDALFLSQYLSLNWAPVEGYGAEAADCAFAQAEYSSL